MGKVTIPLKVRGYVADVGGGQLQYKFEVAPMHKDGKFYVFIHYCYKDQRDRMNKVERSKLAKVLRFKHNGVWARYHEWRRRVT